MKILGPIEGLDIRVVTTSETLDAMIEHLSQHEVIAFDTETNGLDIHKEETKSDKMFDQDFEDAWEGNEEEYNQYIRTNYGERFEEGFKLVGMSFAADPVISYYVPVGHVMGDQLTFDEVPLIQLAKQDALDAVRPLLSDKKIIAHNMKFDKKVMEHFGVPIPDPYFCTYLAQAVIHHDEVRGLKQLTKHLLNRSAYSLTDMLGKGNYDLSPLDPSQAALYAGPDASNCYGLYEIYSKIFEENQDLAGIFKLEMKVLNTVIQMETAGFLLDDSVIDDIVEILDSKEPPALDKCREALSMAQGSIKDISGDDFDPKKGVHVSRALYNVFNLPFSQGKGATSVSDAPSGASSRKTLSKLQEDTELMERKPEADKFINALFSWREIVKLRSTYTRNLQEKVAQNGRLYPEFKQVGTDTGRMSGKNPNTMNLPTRSDEYDIRKIFMEEDPFILIGADYDAMEMRIAAGLSGDPILSRIVLGDMKVSEVGIETETESKRKDDNGEPIILTPDSPVDIHCYTVMSILGIPYPEIDNELRSSLKPVGFGILYGSTKVGLARTLGVPENTAQHYIDMWFRTFSGVKKFMDSCVHFIVNNGYMATYSGRRRYIKAPYDAMTPMERAEALKEPDMQAQIRQLSNMRIQGTGADVTKTAMVKMYNKIKEHNLDAALVCQIHDELVVKCLFDDRHKVAKMLEESMYYELRNENGVMPLTSGARATRNLSKAAENLLRRN